MSDPKKTEKPNLTGGREALILLAAGASSRLGAPKQLLTFGGQTLLRHAIETAITAACSPIIVVLGATADRMREECLGLPVQVVENAEWQEGMASSVRAGIAAAEAAGVADATFLLVDQPLVTPQTLRSLIELRRSEKRLAAACDYGDGALGPPCVFDRSLFPDLLALHGAHGARQLLARLPRESVATLPCPEAARDIDTLDDWEKLTALSTTG